MGGIIRVTVPGFSYRKLITKKSYCRKIKIGLGEEPGRKGPECVTVERKETEREVAVSYMIPTIFGRGGYSPPA